MKWKQSVKRKLMINKNRNVKFISTFAKEQKIMSPILEIENVSKQYRLGYIGTGSLSDDLHRWWCIIRGKEDPFQTVGEENDRNSFSTSDYVWALRNIDLKIEQGDIIGIIGKNGAGKSTLLKILSRVTTPTTGKITARGRIASLLEVGTGFHGELSGRDNIYLNGAILGMRRSEIQLKLDEIIAFSGCERYIDTPVKRYSSGMYVRLAFAVAAHLDTEILIVDEVLAVGDAEFQKKAIGKMQDISKGQGKTVLFVSHNMESIERLCNKTILMEKGSVSSFGNTNDIIREYLITHSKLQSQTFFDSIKNDLINISQIYCHTWDNQITDTFSTTQKIGITVKYEVLAQLINLIPAISVKNEFGVDIFHSHDVSSDYYQNNRSFGMYSSTVWIQANMMAEGIFSIGIVFLRHVPFTVYLNYESVLRIRINDTIDGDSARGICNMNFPGIIRPKLEWETKILK